MAAFEALYGKRFRSSITWFEVGEFAPLCPKIVYDDMEKVRLIREVENDL